MSSPKIHGITCRMLSICTGMSNKSNNSRSFHSSLENRPRSEKRWIWRSLSSWFAYLVESELYFLKLAKPVFEDSGEWSQFLWSSDTTFVMCRLICFCFSLSLSLFSFFHSYRILFNLVFHLWNSLLISSL